MNDQLWRGTAFSGQFRVLAVSSTQTAQTMRDLHDLSPVNTLLLGKMIPAGQKSIAGPNSSRFAFLHLRIRLFRNPAM